MATTNALLTAEEFSQLPETHGPMELVLGHIVMMNMPNYRHGAVCSRVSRLLGNFVEEHDLGTVVTNDSGIITRRDPDSVRGADVAYYSYTRMPKGVEPQGYPAQPPELVFEVKSPSDNWEYLLSKTDEFLQTGVVKVCVANPENETASIFFANRKNIWLDFTAQLTFPDLLPGFSVPVSQFFNAV